MTQLLIHLRDRDRQSDRLVQMSMSVIKGQRSADICYLSYEKVNQRLFGNDLLQLLQLLKSRLHRQVRDRQTGQCSDRQSGERQTGQCGERETDLCDDVI